MAEQSKAPPAAPPRRAAPSSAPPLPPPAASSAPSGRNFSVSSGKQTGAQRIVIYGPGGVGKSSLAALAPAPVFLDIETGTRELDVARITGIEAWEDLRSCLRSSSLDAYKTVVIDTATKAEEWAIAHVLRTVETDKKEAAQTLESYGWGKGYQHAYDVFMLLLVDLDTHVRQGRNVILIAHDCTSNVPNPTGEDFIRYEPHLQTNKGGKASIRNKVFQWADHVLFIGYDIAVSKDGKGKGEGTRTIWPYERATHVAKSRSLPPFSMPYRDATDGAIWSALFDGGAK